MRRLPWRTAILPAPLGGSGWVLAALLFACLCGAPVEASPLNAWWGTELSPEHPADEESMPEDLHGFYVRSLTRGAASIPDFDLSAKREAFRVDVEVTTVQPEVQPYWDPNVIEGGPALDLDPRFLLGIQVASRLAVFIDGEDLVPGSEPLPWPTDAIVHFGIAISLVGDLDVRLYPSVNLEVTPFGIEDLTGRELRSHAPHRAVAELAWSFGRDAAIRGAVSADRPHDGRPVQPGGWLLFELRF